MKQNKNINFSTNKIKTKLMKKESKKSIATYVIVIFQKAVNPNIINQKFIYKNYNLHKMKIFEITQFVGLIKILMKSALQIIHYLPFLSKQS